MLLYFHLHHRFYKKHGFYEETKEGSSGVAYKVKQAEENKEMFKEQETVSAKHILVDNEELCSEIKGKIDSGELTFEEAAKGCKKEVSYHKIENCPECGKALFKKRGGVISCLNEGCGFEKKASRKKGKEDE